MLRNLKLEPPKPSDEEVPRLTAAGAAGGKAAAAAAADDALPVAEQPPQPSKNETAASDDLDQNSPANLGRLVVKDDDGAESEAGTGVGSGATIKRSSRPKFTWFSLYDEQGVGGRRNSTLGKATNSGGALFGGVDDSGAVDKGDGGRTNGGSRTPKESSSKRKPEGSWRWGWGRKGSGNSSTQNTADTTTTPEGGTVVASMGTSEDTEAAGEAAALSPVAAEETPASSSGGQAEQDGSYEAVGGDVEPKEEEAPQGLEVLSTMRTVSSGEGEEGSATAATAAAAGRRLAQSVQRERQRLRRKDVYSYFMMPLVRALEAQMGTTAWLRKVSYRPVGSLTNLMLILVLVLSFLGPVLLSHCCCLLVFCWFCCDLE